MECAWLTAVASRKTVGGFPRLKNGKILSEMEFADDQVSQASFMMPNSTRVVMLDDPKAVDDTFDNTDNIGLSLFGVGEWVGGGGGAGRVVWGYGYHVVVHRRPATA